MAIPGTQIGGTYNICLTYFSGLNVREYPQKIWPNIWYSQYLHFPLISWKLIGFGYKSKASQKKTVKPPKIKQKIYNTGWCPRERFLANLVNTTPISLGLK
jgi:hypothetical protein